MDYNWLEQVPSSVTPIPVYQPDFGFLQSMQMKANQQYEQGFKEVKNAYASIFDRAVTGEEANKRQQNYKKQALDQMKAIAATDLSDPKNVLAAENIMSPFYDDQEYVKNIAFTSHYQNEKSKQETIKNSTDKNTRALYNPLVDYYIDNGIKQLADAPMTKDAYSKLEMRKSIGIVNIADIANKEIKDAGYIKTVDAQGNAMYITTNGPKSVEAYSSVYKAIAARPEYAEQNRVLSIARMEMEKDKFKRDNPNIPESEFNQQFAQNAIDGNIKYYTTAIADNRKLALEWRMKNAIYQDLDTNGFPTNRETKVKSPEIQQNIFANLTRASEFENLAKKYEDIFTKEFGYVQTDASKFSTNPEDYVKGVSLESPIYQQRLNDIRTNTQDYIQNLYLNHDADAFAKSIANISSVELKVNPVQQEANRQAAEVYKEYLSSYKAQTAVEQKQETIDLKAIEEKRKLGLPLEQEDIDKMYGTGFDTKSLATPIGEKGQGIDLGSGKVGFSGTALKKISTIEAFNAAKAQKVINMNTIAFGSDGMLQMLSDGVIPGGLTGPEILTLSGEYTKSLTTGNFSAASQPIREKLAKLINNYHPNNKTYSANTNAEDVRQALSAITLTDATDPLFKTVDPKKQALVISMAQRNQAMQKDMQDLKNMISSYNKNLGEVLNNANNVKKYSKILVDENEGITKTDPNLTDNAIVNADIGNLRNVKHVPKYRIANNNDVIKILKPITVFNQKTNTYKTISPNELASAFTSGLFKEGDIDISGGIIFQMNGEDYRIANPRDGSFWKTDKEQHNDKINFETAYRTLTNLTNRFGKSSEFSKLKNEITSVTVNKIPQFNTGTSSPEITFDLSGTGKDVDLAQKATGDALLNAIQSPVNVDKMYTVDGSGNEIKGSIPEEIKTAIFNAKFKDFRSDIAGSVTYIPRGPNGGPTIRINTQLGKGEKDKETIGTTKVEDIKSKSAIYVDISENAKDEILQQLPRTDVLQRYASLLTTSDAIHQDDFEEKNGFMYTIQADPNSMGPEGKYTKVHVYTSEWQIDPHTGEYIMENGKPKYTYPLTEQVFQVGVGGYSIDHICEQMKNNWIIKQMQKRKDLLEYYKNQPSVPGTSTIGDIYKQFGL